MTRRADDIAAELRKRIISGEVQPGENLPSIRDAQAGFGVTAGTVRTAYKHLQTEGLIQSMRGRGNVVVGADPQRITRNRFVHRDGLGYYFDKSAQDFRAIGTPQVQRGPLPFEIARHFGAKAGTEAVIRDRVLGLPGARRVRPTPLQIATSYLPAWLAAELPIIATEDTGPGGIYDRIEEWAGEPLRWDEFTTAKIADGFESHRLRVPMKTALLRLVRTATLADGRTVEVNDTRMDGTRFELFNKLTRSSSASWPVTAANSGPHAAHQGEGAAPGHRDDTRGGEARG